MSKQRVVVICPGRGTYNKEELGYLSRFHSDKGAMVDTIDTYRSVHGQLTIAELDSMSNYSMKTHTAGENASPLIYGCSMGDFASIDRDKYDIVAVTGNSMGWYIALAAAGALSPTAGIEVINTMGSMMTDGLIGGQMIYPLIDDNWRWDQSKVDSVNEVMMQVNCIENAQVHTSIHLGGYIVFGANALAMRELEARLPKIQDRYPMKLYNHGAFHTPMLAETSAKAKQMLSTELFQTPNIPLIDGQGNIWKPYSTDTQALYDYTLGTQVHDTYNFTKAIEVAVKEFAPDKLIILGPGATLGGAVAQSLIKHNWQDMECKKDFTDRQKSDPFILAMGMEEQRALVV
ncbi:MAG: [acyl-carrier-protein] S-malonyltransferase [Phenylobacterium sp.]|jgi:[acyl-carrier-protein] S-malonyltransferase